MQRCLKSLNPHKYLNISFLSSMSTIDLKQLAENQLKPLGKGQEQTFSNLWNNESVVVIFFRRWGCAFCRVWAKEVSEIAPILKSHNVKLVGVSFDDIGAEEFIDGKFFDGDLYISQKNIYNTLGFKRFSWLSILASFAWKETRDAMNKSKKMGVGGNLTGDGLQNGGALIVDKGGKLITHFIQDGPAEHMSNTAILKALSLDNELNNLPNLEADVVTSPGECKRN